MDDEDLGWGGSVGGNVSIPVQIAEIDLNQNAPMGMPLFSRLASGECMVCSALSHMPDMLDTLNYLLTVNVCTLDDEDRMVALKARKICEREMKKRKINPQIIASLTIESISRHVSHLKNPRIMAARYYNTMSSLFHNQLANACDEDGEIPKEKVASIKEFSKLAYQWHVEAKEAEQWAREQKNGISEDLGKVTTMDIDA